MSDSNDLVRGSAHDRADGAARDFAESEATILQPAPRTMEWANAPSLGLQISGAQMLIIAGTLVLAAAAAMLVQALRARSRARFGDAWQQLARASGLSRADVRLLRGLSVQAGLASGGGIFFSSGCFDHVAQKGPRGSGMHRRLKRLRSKLHGDR